MNLTRRNILKALGIGAAVSVSGASIAKEREIVGGVDGWNLPIGGKFTNLDEGTITYKGPLHVWNESVEYTVGETVNSSDGEQWMVISNV